MRKNVAAATLVVLLAGCGGGGDDPTAKGTATASGPMDAGQWAGKVVGICNTESAHAKQVGEDIGRKSAAAGDSKAELTAKVLDAEADLVGPLMDKIDALPKPQGKASQESDFSSGMRKTATLLKQTAKAIRDNDESAGKQATTDLVTEVKATRDQATALGIGKCNPPAADSLGG